MKSEDSANITNYRQRHVWGLPGRVGMLAGQADIAFDDVQVTRVDWPTPAAPTWQVLSGQFDFQGHGGAQLQTRGGDPLALAVREGSYGDNYDIETYLYAEGGRPGLPGQGQAQLLVRQPVDAGAGLLQPRSLARARRAIDGGGLGVGGDGGQFAGQAPVLAGGPGERGGSGWRITGSGSAC